MKTLAALDVANIRADFPILGREVHGRPLVYLDSAASSQKPRAVIEAMSDYLSAHHANVHRGAHQLSVEATDAYEGARAKVARFTGASRPEEIVFTRGTTEAINLVAYAWGRGLGPDDEIVLTVMEHHSNIVPWQLLAERTGARLRFATLTPEGRLDLDHLASLVGPATRLVGVTHVSNTLGVMNPVGEIAALAHQAGALCLVDGAQAAPHGAVDVQALGCDFYAFSAHKMCGPTGIGALWARIELLEAMPPFQGGGEMISEVRLEGSTWAPVPHKFEAGTPAIAEVVGFGAAVDYLESVGFDAIRAHEEDITRYALGRLADLDGLQIVGPTEDRLGVVSFTYGDIHPHDLATILDRRGVAIRAGHHCNQPLMDYLGVDATARASFYLYTSRAEIDALVDALLVARDLFGGFD
ncbi:MAG TPA: cysteine desulfurase [Gemmatimonadota bacterium]|nr:cysteine desulfurase [Gemmatimonadota bacterium]